MFLEAWEFLGHIDASYARKQSELCAFYKFTRTVYIHFPGLL